MLPPLCSLILLTIPCWWHADPHRSHQARSGTVYRADRVCRRESVLWRRDREAEGKEDSRQGEFALPTITLAKRKISTFGRLFPGAEAFAVEIVLCLDDSHRPGFRAHHHRVGDRAAREAPHPLEHSAAGDARSGEHDIALGKIEEPVFAAEIADAAAPGALALVVVAEDQATLHEAADAAERRGGEHAFGRTARAHVDIDAAVGTRGGDDAA